MKKVWFLIVTTFASLVLLVGCAAPTPLAGTSPVTESTITELEQKQAEIDKLKIEKLEAEKEALEAEVAESKEPVVEKGTLSQWDQTYLTKLREEVPAMSMVDDPTLVEFGNMVCEQIKNDTSVVTIVQMAEDEGFTQEEAVQLLSVSVGAYCPEEIGTLK